MKFILKKHCLFYTHMHIGIKSAKPKPINIFVNLFIIGYLFLLGNNTVYAGIFSDSEARKAITNLTQQVNEQTQQKNAQYTQMQTAILDLQNHIENLRHERNKLNGQLEIIQLELQKSKQNYQLLANTYTDKLDAQQKTINELTEDVAKIKQNTEGKISIKSIVHNNSTLEKSNYEEKDVANNINNNINAKITRVFNIGLKYFNQGDFKKSADIFNELLADNTDSSLMPLLTYYLANSYYGLKKYKQALIQMKNFISNYPSDAKIPDVYLMLANVYFEMHDTINAKKTLEYIINTYTQHDVFSIAKKRLTEIKK